MKRAENGAALLDAMIALALAAMIAGAAGGVIRAGLFALERAGESSAQGEEALTLRRALADALTRIDRAQNNTPAFMGGAGHMTWRGVLPSDGGWRSGVWRLEGNTLALARCPDFMSSCERRNAPWPASKSPVRFAYAGADGEWRGDWPAGEAPALIRLEFSGALEEIIIAPRVMGAAP